MLLERFLAPVSRTLAGCQRADVRQEIQMKNNSNDMTDQYQSEPSAPEHWPILKFAFFRGFLAIGLFGLALIRIAQYFLGSTPFSSLGLALMSDLSDYVIYPCGAFAVLLIFRYRLFSRNLQT